jgi:aminoglycoside phosphotransferase (APT) family kinase protein
LRLIHDALEDYAGELPGAGRADKVFEMLAAVEAAPDVELLLRLAAQSPPAPRQALHGDAHLENCLGAHGTTLWHDFESACCGPREYDLAAMLLREYRLGDDVRAREALAAYGTHDRTLVDAFVPVYAAWVYASMILATPRRPDLAPLLAERLRWLRATYG